MLGYTVRSAVLIFVTGLLASCGAENRVTVRAYETAEMCVAYDNSGDECLAAKRQAEDNAFRFPNMEECLTRFGRCEADGDKARPVVHAFHTPNVNGVVHGFGILRNGYIGGVDAASDQFIAQSKPTGIYIGDQVMKGVP